jgi:catechol 2,3-dioxygenase-like lactoylglutathione lyase family enzyme
VLTLDHIQLAMPVGGEADARSFYGTLLGLSEVPKPASLAARGGVRFALGGNELHLGVEDSFSPARKAHPGTASSSLDGLALRLAAAGFSVSWDDSLARRRFYSQDPFGNRLEFLSDLG